MTSDQQTLLSLQNLVTLRRGLSLAGSPPAQLADLDQRIDKFRRKLPGRIIPIFDQVVQLHSNAVTLVIDGECQGCHQRVPRQTIARLAQPNAGAQCNHCQRLLLEEKGAPDYVT